MSIMYHLDSDGGFSAGDTDTGITAYAYPTSAYANRAKRDPEKVARDMLAREGNRPVMPDYDTRNMHTLQASK